MMFNQIKLNNNMKILQKYQIPSKTKVKCQKIMINQSLNLTKIVFNN